MLYGALRRILIFFRVINAIATNGILIQKTMVSTGIMNIFKASLLKQYAQAYTSFVKKDALCFLSRLQIF